VSAAFASGSNEDPDLSVAAAGWARESAWVWHGRRPSWGEGWLQGISVSNRILKILALIWCS
jgi:hypothetical protein